MSPLLPAALCALLAGTHARAELIERSVDLKGAFPADKRNQCRIGACHTFSSIALLEAGIKRKYGKEVRLSEADLFVRKTVESGNYQVFVSAEKGGALQLEALLTESGDPYEDLQYALANGVATQDSAPWDKFLDAYADYKKETKSACSLAYKRSLDNLAAAEPGGAKAGPAQCLGEPSFKSFLDSLMKPGEDAKARTESALLGGDPVSLATQRSMVKDLAKGFSVAHAEYKWSEGRFSDPDACREDGAPRRDKIASELSAGRPLVVCLRIEGLKGWDHRRDKVPAKHCFAATGYEMDKKGMSVESRNSWGGKNPTLQDADFCRIHELVTLEP